MYIRLALFVIIVTLSSLTGLPVRADDQFSLTVGNGARSEFLATEYADIMGCNGSNLTPPLSWKNPPAGTQSFAVTIYDPDASVQGGWWHWILINLPASIDHLDSMHDTNRDLPHESRELHNTNDRSAYTGPCPPVGQRHHYEVSLTAVNIATLPVTNNAGIDTFLSVLQRHSLKSVTKTLFAGR